MEGLQTYGHLREVSSEHACNIVCCVLLFRPLKAFPVLLKTMFEGRSNGNESGYFVEP